MTIISDLTKDTRPSLSELLIEAIQDTVEMDKKKNSYDFETITYENETFYYRAIYLFMQRSVIYYTSEEVEEWSKRELLKEISLPELGGILSDS